MNFKLGDTLICVNNDVVEKELTVGKEYKVVKERLDNIVIPYQVINDRGEQTGYFGYRFKLKEEKCLNSNKELLDWAVENIKEWDDYYEYLFVDKTTRVFYSSKKEEWNYDSYGYWASYNQSWVYAKNHMGKPLEYKSINPQVITKQEWLDAKKEKEDMSNTFNLKDLKTGQRITFEDGYKFIVFKDTPHCYDEIADFVVEEGVPVNWEHLTHVNIDEVVKVETPIHPYTLLNKVGWEGKYNTVWERQVKSEQDTEKENLQKVINKLQQDLQNAQQQLDNLGGK